MWIRSLGRKDPLQEGMATHSSILAWKIPWTEEPGRLQSIGLQQRVGHDLRHTHTHTQPKIRCLKHIYFLTILEPRNQNQVVRRMVSSEASLLGL